MRREVRKYVKERVVTLLNRKPDQRHRSFITQLTNIHLKMAGQNSDKDLDICRE